MNDVEAPSGDVVALLAAGRKIDAIKRVRDERQLGLKEARNYVDDYLRRHPEQFPAARRPGGNARGLIYIIVVLLVLAAFEIGARFG